MTSKTRFALTGLALTCQVFLAIVSYVNGNYDMALFASFFAGLSVMLMSWILSSVRR